jgi:hypothetical protein
MDNLPTETILHIISFLPKWDLKHYSLVSTRFAPLAQQALFKAVEVLEPGRKIHSAEFVDFVNDVIERPRIGLMIKRFYIGTVFKQRLHYQPLVQLLGQVSGLRELLCHPNSIPPSIPFQPHQFPLLQKIMWSLRGPGTDILHTLLPYSPIIDLSLFGWFQSQVAFDALLELKPPKWANNLVRYTGPSYLIEGLSEDAKLLHFCSTNSLSEEETLRGLASKRLLSLHVWAEMYRWSLEGHILPSLLPSLFPNLQSVAWFVVELKFAVRYFSKISKLHTNGHLQSLDTFQDPANGDLITCLQQLWDLRRVAFSFVYLPGNEGEPLERFITDLQEFVQERNLPLESIQTLVHTGGRRWCRRWTKHRNARDDLVSWEVEYGFNGTPQFVDR